MHKAGFVETVASLGTSLTREHVQILQRYNPSFILLYDGDQAGINAARRGVETCMEAGFTPSIALLPQGVDPDDYLKEHGTEAMQNLLSNAQDGYQFYLDQLIKTVDIRKPEGKTQLVNQMVPLLSLIPESYILQDYERVLAERIGSSIDDLHKSLVPKLRKKNNEPFQKPTTPKKKTNDPWQVLKESIIRLFALHHKLVDKNIPQVPIMNQSQKERFITLLEPQLNSNHTIDKILRTLFNLQNTNDDRKEAIRLAEIFDHSQEQAYFLEITEAMTYPTLEKDLIKFRDHTLAELEKEILKQQHSQIIQSSHKDPDKALQALNDLLLKERS
jgi:DNA primase